MLTVSSFWLLIDQKKAIAGTFYIKTSWILSACVIASSIAPSRSIHLILNKLNDIDQRRFAEKCNNGLECEGFVTQAQQFFPGEHLNYSSNSNL